MEPLFLSVVLLTLSLFVSLLLHASYKKQSRNLPPGRMGWPIVGETLEFLSMGRKGIPEKFIEERRKKYCSDIFKTSLLVEKTAVVCGPSANKFVFSNENKLVRVWWPRSVEKVFPTSLQTSTNEESMKMRHLISGFLKPEALAKYIGFTDVVARKHFETYWDFNQQVDAFPLSKRYTFAVACRLFLSIEDPKHIAKFEEPFSALALGILSLPINFPGTAYNQAIKAAKMIRKELVDIIRERKKDLSCRERIVDEVASSSSLLKHDILSHMLTTTDENGQFMNEMDIADKIIGLLIGGHDTSSAAITFTLNYLAELPEIYDKVLKEQAGIAAGKKHGEPLNWEDLQKMKYSYNVVCEVMRLAPPFPGNFREALTDFTFSGFSVPKGWKLYWTTNSTHKDPKYFPEPEKFDPSRFEGNGPAPYTYVPFGGGPRMCPGKEYSRLVVLVFMYNVIRRFRWEKILPNEKMIVDPMPKPAEGLPIRIHPHKI